MDIYLVNSGPCDFYTPPNTAAQRTISEQPRWYLHRRHREGRRPRQRVRLGAAAGDYNSDGFPDLYVTQYPRNILYRNNGDGTFTDVTAKAGVTAPGWGTSAVWFDYDNDGRLDLFVCGFVRFLQGQRYVLR